MNTPTTEKDLTVVVSGGAGAHGRHHVKQFLESGVGRVILVDPNGDETSQTKQKTINRGSFEEFLLHTRDKIHIFLDSSPDELHITHLQAMVTHDPSAIFCVEKPVVSHPGALATYTALLERVGHGGGEVTTCLPRIMDAPYRTLKRLLGGLITQYGPIFSIKHTFGFEKTDTIASAGRDHLAHEISLILNLLEGLHGGGCVQYKEIKDSPTNYKCSGEIGGIIFEVGGNRRASKSEMVEIVLGNGTKIHLDALTGKITISQGTQTLNEHTVGSSNPTERLTGVTTRLIQMALGKKPNYLLPHILNAAVHGPATVFNQIT